MRTDERIAAAFRDTQDLHALLLGSTGTELVPLCVACGVEKGTKPHFLAKAVEQQIAASLPNDNGQAPLLHLGQWAAVSLGAAEAPHSIEDADKDVMRLLEGGVEALDNAKRKVSEKAQLLQIAVEIAKLRRKKLRRLNWWRPFLDRIVGSGRSGADTPKSEREPTDTMKVRPDIENQADDALWDIIKSAGKRLPLTVWEERLSDARKKLAVSTSSLPGARASARRR